MRLWPGGLCVSRSIGDLDAGSEVVPVPHIRQVGAEQCVISYLALTRCPSSAQTTELPYQFLTWPGLLLAGLPCGPFNLHPFPDAAGCTPGMMQSLTWRCRPGSQVLLPVEGCRVVMASDGLWDVLTFTKALKLTRSKPTGAAASALVTAVSRDLRTLDDASIIIVDMLPTEGTSFPTVALRANPNKPGACVPGAAG
jgi:serine/threonine protein phosphatase PrpC